MCGNRFYLLVLFANSLENVLTSREGGEQRARLTRPRCSRGCFAASPVIWRHITLPEARSRLDRSRFPRSNTHVLAVFKFYKKIIFSRANFANSCSKIDFFCKNCENFNNFLKKLQTICKFVANLFARR